MNMKSAFAAFGAMTILSAPAFADNNNGFGVGSSAVVGVYDLRFGGIAQNGAAYRMGQDSSGVYSRIGDTPPVNFEGCSARAQFGDLCVASQGGTNVSDFNQTASSSNASLTFAFPGEVGSRSISASSYANLATGKIGATVTADYFESGYAISEFRDTLAFTIVGANEATVTNITVSFLLDGSLLYGPAGSSIENQFNFGNGRGLISYNGSDSNNFQTLSAANWVSYDFGAATSGFTRFTGVYALTGSAATIGIRDYLRAETAHLGSVLYSNTSAFSLVLPSNVTYTSASGVFLTGGAGPGGVPEPATWAMLLTGFGLIGSAARRRATNHPVVAA
jgi:hypothetical protein